MDHSTALQPDEAELVAGARAGAGAAWEQILHSHQEPVFRLAYLILGDAYEAEDVAQETFLRAYRALERFDATRPLRPWLLSIAANLARNRHRSAGRYLAALTRLFHNEPPTHTPRAAVEEHSARRWQAGQLWQAVQRLGPADQQVIYLRFFLGLSVEETAQACEVAPGTVKSRLHRALERLRAVLQREFPGLYEQGGWEGSGQ